MSHPRKSIFLVDDHTLVREWLSNLLRQEPDFEVCGQAENATRALADMIAAPPTVAVVDLSLKTGSGLDLIKDLRHQCPATRVVVLSMHEEIYYVERALRAGARAYVTKSDSTNRIVEAIRAVIAGRVYANADTLEQLTRRQVGQPPSPRPPSAELLSDREMEVFQRLGAGHGTRLIAGEMSLSMKTVQSYYARIKVKLGLTTGSELMREAVRWVETEKSL